MSHQPSTVTVLQNLAERMCSQPCDNTYAVWSVFRWVLNVRSTTHLCVVLSLAFIICWGNFLSLDTDHVLKMIGSVLYLLLVKNYDIYYIHYHLSRISCAFRMISQTELMAHDVTSPINSKTPRTTAYQKTHESWGSVLGSAFLANYLVNLGVWQATAAQDIVSKIFATLFPVGAFVTMGFNHLIGEILATRFFKLVKLEITVSWV